MNYLKYSRWRLKKPNLFLRMNKKGWFGLLIIILALLFYFRAAILTTFGEFLVVDTQASMPVADFGIVLSGEYPERAMEAASLYREGAIKRVIVSQNAALHGLQLLRQWKVETNDDTSNNYNLLLRLGVRREDLSLSPSPSAST